MTLPKEQCEPCRKGGTPLSLEEARPLAADVPEWTCSEKEIERLFEFNSFSEAIAFVNKVAEIAESEDHHPDIFIDYSRVTLTLWSKKIGGLSRNDFILAAKIDRL